MNKELLINVSAGEECRIALLEDGRLEELYMERTSATSHVGNIYKGKVTNVEASIQAAFVDFGIGRNGFLHISDLMPTYFGRKGDGIVETVGRKLSRRDRPPIQQCLRRGDEIIVQIIKEGIGTKGPTLSSYLSIPGRVLVMMPGMGKMGVSKKIEDDEERRRLRSILDGLEAPDGVGFIIRTAGIGKSAAEIERDLKYLTRLWETITEKQKSPGTQELYVEGDLVTRTVRDVWTPDIDRIIVDNKDVGKRIKEFFKLAMPRTKSKVELHVDPQPLFHAYKIEAEIEQMYSRHVPLPSGGSLVIDSTEAVVAIDVNSGKSRDHKDAETTAFKTDMEAADEIPRQLRLRDLGGVIICDFIDLRFERHRRELEERLHENLKNDRAKTKVLRMSQFGIIEMTRQRMRPSLKRSIYSDCQSCLGSGLVKTPESMALDVMRRLAIAAHHERVSRVELNVCPDVAAYLLNRKRIALADLEAASGKPIYIGADSKLGNDEIKLSLFDSRDGFVILAELGMVHPGQQPQSSGPDRGARRRGRGSRGGDRHRDHAPSAKADLDYDFEEEDGDEPQHRGGPREPDSDEPEPIAADAGDEDRFEEARREPPRRGSGARGDQRGGGRVSRDVEPEERAVPEDNDDASSHDFDDEASDESRDEAPLEAVEPPRSSGRDRDNRGGRGRRDRYEMPRRIAPPRDADVPPGSDADRTDADRDNAFDDDRSDEPRHESPARTGPPGTDMEHDQDDDFEGNHRYDREQPPSNESRPIGGPGRRGGRRDRYRRGQDQNRGNPNAPRPPLANSNAQPPQMRGPAVVRDDDADGFEEDEGQPDVAPDGTPLNDNQPRNDQGPGEGGVRRRRRRRRRRGGGSAGGGSAGGGQFTPSGGQGGQGGGQFQPRPQSERPPQNQQRPPHAGYSNQPRPMEAGGEDFDVFDDEPQTADGAAPAPAGERPPQGGGPGGQPNNGPGGQNFQGEGGGRRRRRRRRGGRGRNRQRDDNGQPQRPDTSHLGYTIADDEEQSVGTGYEVGDEPTGEPRADAYGAGGKSEDGVASLSDAGFDAHRAAAAPGDHSGHVDIADAPEAMDDDEPATVVSKSPDDDDADDESADEPVDAVKPKRTRAKKVPAPKAKKVTKAKAVAATSKKKTVRKTSKKAVADKTGSTDKHTLDKEEPDADAPLTSFDLDAIPDDYDDE